MEDGTIQYGARDKLTRKINVRSRFVSSPFRAGEVAPGFSRTLLPPRIHDILSSDTLNLGDRERGGETERMEEEKEKVSELGVQLG